MKLFARLALAALAALVMLAASSPARAQQPAPPVTLEIQAGLDSEAQFRAGHWFPVTVIAANDGPDLRGALEWRFPGEESGTFRYELDLPRGARKQISIPVVGRENHGVASVAFVVDGQPLVRRNVRLDPIAADQLAVGVISSDPALLNSLRAIETNGIGTTVLHISPERLPADAALLAGLEVLFVHDLSTADLTTAQREAIALWVRLGGELVVSGGPAGERSIPGLADLLPVEVGRLRADVPSDSLSAMTTGLALPALTANAVTLRPGATALDEVGLIAAHDVGAGRVIFTAFDLAALRAWADEAALWQQVLKPETRALIGQSFRLRSENLLRDALQIAALRLPSTGVLLLLMLVYIVVVGPLNFLLLRRAKRVELAWVTTPLIVAAFLAAAYGASFVLRGTEPQVSQLTVVQGFEGARQGQATAFVGIFSPQRRSYSVGFDPGTLITPGTFEGFMVRAAPVTGSDSTARVDDLLIDVSALRTLMVEQQVALALEVTSNLRRAPGAINGELTIARGPALRDAVVVSGNAGQPLGDLRPGDTATVDLDRTLRNFPDQLQFGAEGLFRRSSVMYSLFGYDRFTAGGPTFQGDSGLPERDGVYLIGWADGPATALTIDGGPARRQGETLYIIRLDR